MTRYLCLHLKVCTVNLVFFGILILVQVLGTVLVPSYEVQVLSTCIGTGVPSNSADYRVQAQSEL